MSLLANYAECQDWPGVGEITTGHIEAYFSYLQDRPRWFGERDKDLSPPSRSHVETQYRRIKRFFNWLLERGHVESNPLALIPHPKVEERVVPTLPEKQILGLFTITDPQRATTSGEQFRAVRNSAALCLLLDTPGRRNEIGQLTVDHLDLDVGTVLVTGKGSRQRWMPLGKRSVAALWEYLQARASSPSEDYLTALAGQRQWIATTNFAGCPSRPPDSFANSAVLTTSAKVPDALGWPIDPCFPVQIDPKAEQFEQVVACADQRPFAVHLLQSPQQELPESPALLDLAEYRLHSLHAGPSITTTDCPIWCLILRIRPRARNRGTPMTVRFRSKSVAKITLSAKPSL